MIGEPGATSFVLRSQLTSAVIACLSTKHIWPAQTRLHTRQFLVLGALVPNKVHTVTARGLKEVRENGKVV